MAEEAFKYGLLALQLEDKAFTYQSEDEGEVSDLRRETARTSFDRIADMARLHATRLDG